MGPDTGRWRFMIDGEQHAQLERTIERLNEVLDAAERRVARSMSNDGQNPIPSVDDAIELSMIAKLQRVVAMMRTFQDANRETVESSASGDIKSLRLLQKAVIEQWQLNRELEENLQKASPFRKKILEKTERWLNILNMLQLAQLNALCLESIRRKLAGIGTRSRPSIRIVENSRHHNRSSHTD